jgi:UDP-N-acetylmuramate-alanine ligase
MIFREHFSLEATQEERKLVDWASYFITQGPHMAPLGNRAATLPDPDAIVARLASELHRGDHVLVMSNGGFGGLHEKLLGALERSA